MSERDEAKDCSRPSRSDCSSTANGSMRPDGRTFDVVDPATGRTLCSVADASPADGRAALDAAVAAQPDFAAASPRERADILTRAYELLHERIDDLALLMTLEMGKPVAEARGEIAYAAEFFRHFAEEAVRIDGGYQTAPAGGARFLVARQPVGPCLLITPWNFPMAMGTRKLGPAIAAGCTSVIKPAHQTPLSMLALMDILAEAGVPAGVVNCITVDRRRRGDGAADPVGPGAQTVVHRLHEGRPAAAGAVRREGSADVNGTRRERAVHRLRRRRPRRGGRGCDRGQDAQHGRGVHRGQQDVRALLCHRRVRSAGWPRGWRHCRWAAAPDEGVTVGPLIDKAALRKVESLVADAVERGATVLTGGSAPRWRWLLLSADRAHRVCRPTPRCADQEIFGPVAPLTPFETEADAVAAANNTEYGLVSYVFTNDLRRALRVAEALESGMVGLNQGVVSNPAAPFGGIKQSGLGREGGSVGIDEFLETKYIGIAMRLIAGRAADAFGTVDGRLVGEPIDGVVHVGDQQPVGELAVAGCGSHWPTARCSLSRTSDVA